MEKLKILFHFFIVPIAMAILWKAGWEAWVIGFISFDLALLQAY